jgi:hypothetical protein
MMAATSTNLVETLLTPFGSIFGLIVGWYFLRSLLKGVSSGWKYCWELGFTRIERLEEMHGVVATVIVTFLIFLGYAARGSGDLFVQLPEMLIVVAAVSAEVIYDRLTSWVERGNGGYPRLILWALPFCAVVIFLRAGFIVNGHIAHEVAEHAKQAADQAKQAVVETAKPVAETDNPNPYEVAGLWLAAFAVAIWNKWVQGSLKIKAKEQENAQLIEAQKQECAQLIEAQKQKCAEMIEAQKQENAQ